MRNKTWVMIPIMFYIMSFNAWAQQIDKSTTSQAANTIKLLYTITIFIICYRRRKKAIGGWLLFYFISLFFSIFVWGILFFSSLPNLNPMIWNDKRRYIFFIISYLPDNILLIIQTVVSVMLLKLKDWRFVKLLRTIILAQIVVSLILSPIDLIYFPENIAMGIIGLISPLIWLLYFSFSKRVRSVYQKKDWV